MYGIYRVGDVTTATQMVWMVVELHLLVYVPSWKLFFAALDKARACAASKLPSLQQKPLPST